MTFESLFAETDAAKIEITHKTAWAATLEAAPDRTRRKLRYAIRLNYH